MSLKKMILFFKSQTGNKILSQSKSKVLIQSQFQNSIQDCDKVESNSGFIFDSSRLSEVQNEGGYKRVI